MSNINICEKCMQPSLHECKECDKCFCCSCEDDDHWADCKSFEIDNLEKAGICLKARRDILPGEVILSELPLVLTPKLPQEEGYVPCVGCCRSFSSKSISHCPECCWPACTPSCEDLSNLLTHGLECKLLKLLSVEDFRFDLLLPLRVLCLQIINKPLWDNLLKNISDFDDCDITLLEDIFLTKLKKYEEESNTIILEDKSKETLQKILTFLKHPYRVEDLWVFYPISGFIQHSCTPNTSQTFTKNHKLTIKATTSIGKNTQITTSFINLFQGTYKRLLDLQAPCTCTRCTDPTEFDTFFSALKCMGTKNHPCGGTQLPVEPTNNKTMWVCDMCKIELPNDQMIKFLNHLEEEVNKVLSKNPTIDELEEFLAKLLLFLHPNHFHVCRVKRALVKLYSKSEELTPTRKEVCTTLLEIARKFYPTGSPLLTELQS